MLHRVNKLQFEAFCANEAEAFEVRTGFAQSFQDQVSDIIDRICSKYITAEEWLHIPLIEVDLGHMDLDTLQNKLPDLFQLKFEEELSNKLKSHPFKGKESSIQTSCFQILTYFLKSGSLPWWADPESTDIDRVFETLTEQQPIAMRQFLIAHRQESLIWSRIVQQFSHNTHQLIFTLIPSLFPVERRLEVWFSTANSIYQSQAISSVLSPPTQQEFRKFILLHLPLLFIGKMESHDQETLAKNFVHSFLPSHEAILPEEKLISLILATDEAQVASGENVAFNIGEMEIGPENLSGPEAEPLNMEKFNVNTAGIVLLAPYFNPFFKNVGLLENGKWKNREAQQKAIHLIRYLATGELKFPEYQLILEKILCGWNLQTPMAIDIEFSENDISEARALLQSVISNWSRLKNTSVEGLRETFIKRDGIITKKESGWLLQIERKTIDVLLEAIPWSYTPLRFTWTNEMLITEW